MSSTLNVSILVIVTLALWVVANSPLFAALYRYNSDLRGFWIIFTASPNRYLFSLIFMPMALFASLTAWRLVTHYAHTAGLPADHLLRFFTAPASVTLLTLIVCSVATFWDYAAGNHNIADLRAPFAVASLKARNILLTEEVAAAKVQLTPEDTALTIEAAANECITGNATKEVAARLLKEVTTQKGQLADNLLVHTNLVNVFVFALLAWLTVYLLALLALAKQGATTGDAALFTMAKQMLFFSLSITALWVSLRAYELHEYRSFVGGESAESLDLFLGVIVVFAGCLFAAFAFDTPVSDILGMMIIPIAIIVGNVVATSLVRSWYGSGMTFPNFAIISAIWVLLLASMYFVFFKGKA